MLFLSRASGTAALASVPRQINCAASMVPVRPLPDDCGRVWVVRNAFALMETPKEDQGEPATLLIIVTLHQDHLTIVDPSGDAKTLEWASGQNRPDLDLPAVARICRMIETMIANGQKVVLDPTENVACAAAIVGSFMVMKGSPPDAAI